MPDFSSLFPSPDKVYIAVLTPPTLADGFEGSVLQFEAQDGETVLLHTEAYDDLGQCVGRSTVWFNDGSFQREHRLAEAHRVLDQPWMTSFGRRPYSVNRYSRVTPTRKTSATYPVAGPQPPRPSPIGDEGLRLSASSVASFLPGASGGLPDERGLER